MLTLDDIKLIREGLEHLKSKGGSDVLMSGLIKSIFRDNNDKEAFRNEMEREFSEANEKSKILKDKITIVEAKLIKMSDSIKATCLISETKI